MEEAKHSGLSVRDLSIGYGGTPVAQHIDFEVKAGELVGIVGVNGIGKSTLLRTLGGFQPKLGGKILMDGKGLETLNASERSRRLSVVLTQPPASKNLSVEELIALGRQPHTNWLGRMDQGDLEAVGQSLDTFLLSDLGGHKCHQLSDGQMQRVLIARAMAQDTPLILLDEPTTHLDLFHKVQILKLLGELAHKRGKAILFTTHEIELAIQLCDRILILDARENPFGTPCELIEQRHFEKLFPSEMVAFDADTGTFKVKK